MVINLNPATSSNANASGSSVGGGSGGGMSSAGSQSGTIIGGNGNGAGNGNGNGNGDGNGNGNGSGNTAGNASGGATSNLMGIISHVVLEGNIHLHVVCAGDSNAKWITLEEAMAYCPSGVIAYTKLQLAEVYGVPMDLLFD